MTPYEKLKSNIRQYITNYSNNHNLHFYYRGHADNSWKITPSICRNQYEKEHEADILKAQIEKGNWDISKGLFENIAHLQHYGVHTRFLDFSTNADIAIYFACDDANRMQADGEVIVCRYDYRDIDFPETIIITELAMLREPILVLDFVYSILDKYSDILRDRYSYPSVIESLGMSVLSVVDDGFMVTPSQESYKQMMKWNPRIENQRGAFFVPGNKTNPPEVPAYTSNINTTIILPEIADIPAVIRHYDYVKRFKILSSEKHAILEQLSLEKGVNRSFIYPDEV